MLFNALNVPCGMGLAGDKLGDAERGFARLVLGSWSRKSGSSCGTACFLGNGGSTFCICCLPLPQLAPLRISFFSSLPQKRLLPEEWSSPEGAAGWKVRRRRNAFGNRKPTRIKQVGRRGAKGSGQKRRAKASFQPEVTALHAHTHPRCSCPALPCPRQLMLSWNQLAAS